MRRSLERAGVVVTIERVASMPDLDRALRRATWDLVLSDQSMPSLSSMEVLRALQALMFPVPLIIVSGDIGEEAAVSLNRPGVAARRSLTDPSERAALWQRERDLEALHDVALAAGRALDPRRLAEFAVHRGRELLHADGASLHWWDDVGRVLRRIASSQSGKRHIAIELSPGEVVARAAFERGEVVSIENAVSAPLFVGERIVGTLSAGSGSPRRFTPQEIRVLSLLGAQVAPALEADRLVKAAQHAANYDAVTGLQNRTSFLRKLREQIDDSAAQGTSFAVLYADLDRFREINDAFGHEGGDTVLRELGARIARTGRATLDRVARLGVDDFAFLLEAGTGENDAVQSAEDGIQFLRDPFTLSEQPVYLSASVGIAVFPTHGRSAEELLRHAEAAMFAAKRTETRYAIYGTSFDVRSERKIALLRDLRRALETNQLRLLYQPQVDFRTGRLVGAEALLRWRHPERGVIPPLEFIPVAEETGLIYQLTPWVLEHALRQQRAWQRSGLELRMSINVSMRNLRDPEFFAVVDSLVRMTGVDSGWVTLEVTEAAMMLEVTRTLDVMRRIRALGVNISIDDFGTGYSSLAYLSRLPMNEVKIDRAFAMDITRPGPRAIVQAVITLGEVFGLRVVAEGVKDEPTWTQLHRLGCDVAQGYHLSKPIAAEAFATWATRRQ
jgi:diguanylate cyclase (GGDEF)-like protein